MKFCLKLQFSALSGQPPAWPTHDHSVWASPVLYVPLVHLGDFHCTKCCQNLGFCNRAESVLSAGVKPGGIESTAMTIFSIPFFDFFFSTLEIFHEI